MTLNKWNDVVCETTKCMTSSTAEYNDIMQQLVTVEYKQHKATADDSTIQQLFTKLMQQLMTNFGVATAKRRLCHQLFSIKPDFIMIQLTTTDYTVSSGGRSSNQSTTGNVIPPSICTRRSDGFYHDQILLIKTIGTSPITVAAGQGGGAAAA
ncbi:hypothetical protein F511_28491 [Dorcoceras hygrometricum]|uniref:Uncharacterized protein n=1 Tax=Dorcoceras hygrometricum TaxID=472368 RepID=A0A2Z7BZL9_9LAMI|nr:hypothetical protein F511_28491 [Dorcoceras hygrometricum]